MPIELTHEGKQYVLPTGATAVPNTTRTAEAINTVNDDIASGINGALAETSRLSSSINRGRAATLTSSRALLSTDIGAIFFVDARTNEVNITLPDISQLSDERVEQSITLVKFAGDNDITIQGAGSQTINGGDAAFTLNKLYEIEKFIRLPGTSEWVSSQSETINSTPLEDNRQVVNYNIELHGHPDEEASIDVPDLFKYGARLTMTPISISSLLAGTVNQTVIDNREIQLGGVVFLRTVASNGFEVGDAVFHTDLAKGRIAVNLSYVNDSTRITAKKIGSDELQVINSAGVEAIVLANSWQAMVWYTINLGERV